MWVVVYCVSVCLFLVISLLIQLLMVFVFGDLRFRWGICFMLFALIMGITLVVFVMVCSGYSGFVDCRKGFACFGFMGSAVF